MSGFVFGLLVGVVLGIILIKITRGLKGKLLRYIERKRVDYFLTRIDYFKPIEKGSYPKEEDV